MAKETYQDYYNNVLKVLSDNKIHKLLDIKKRVKREYSYTDEELSERLSGGSNLINSRISWSVTFLFQAKAIERVKKAQYKITNRGKQLLEENDVIDNNVLLQFQEFAEYLGKPQIDVYSKDKHREYEVETPYEIIEENFRKINNSLSDELLDTINNSSPDFFEKLVVDLIIKMGYGGSREDAGQAIGKSGDEGIDGIIKEDVLGLDNIYIQAKRWKNSVQRPEIQKFAGALMGKNATKGIFITTSQFSKGAIHYANDINSTIILIDGEKLTNLMLEFNVGVSVESNFELKRIDSDYFDE